MINMINFARVYIYLSIRILLIKVKERFLKFNYEQSYLKSKFGGKIFHKSILNFISFVYVFKIEKE